MPFPAHFLELDLARAGDVAFFWRQRRWTNAQLLDDVEATIDALAEAGVRPGDRISISMPNSPNLAIVLLACLRAGFVAAPINTRFKAHETRAVLDRIEPALHLGSDGRSADLTGVGAAILPPAARVALDDEGGAVAAVRAATAARGRGPGRPAPAARPIDTPALLMPTSGTTGAPKIVAHSLGTLGAIAERYDALGLEPEDVMLNVGPMVHAGGLFNFLASLIRPGPMVMVGAFDADAVLDAIARHGCTWIKALPFLFGELADAQRRHARDVRALRFCLASGDAVPGQLASHFEMTFNLPLHSGWASSEAATSLAYRRDRQPGYPQPAGSEILFRSVGGQPAAESGIGEMLVRGPHVSPGYWSDGAVQPGPGWFETGDVFRRLPDGTLSFVSRCKNLIVRGGSNISPLEIEEVLRRHPGVSDAAVFGVPDARLGERVAALIELRSTASLSATDILREAHGQLSAYKVPEIALIVPRLPRNGAGKVDRAALCQTLGGTPAEEAVSPDRGSG